MLLKFPFSHNVTENYERVSSITTSYKILLTPIPLKAAYKRKYFSYTFVVLYSQATGLNFVKLFLRSSAANCWNIIGFLKAFLDNTNKSRYDKHFSFLNDPVGPAT